MAYFPNASNLLNQFYALQQQGARAKYAEPLAQMELLSDREKMRGTAARTLIDQLTAKYMPEKSLAEIANIRSQAQARNLANQLAQQTMPYDVARSRLGVLGDPMTRMMAEQQEAQRLGIIPKENIQTQQGDQENLINTLFEHSGLQRTGNPTTDRLIASQVYKNFPSMVKAEHTMQGRKELRKEIANKKYIDAVSRTIPEAQKTIETIDLALDNYNKTALTGPILGRIPGFMSEEAQLASKYLSTLQGQMAKELGGSRGATVKDIQLSKAIKPSRSDNPEAVVSQLMTMKALLRRDQEYAKFIGTAIEDYGMSPNKAESVWNKYIKENPLYNYKTGKVITSHIDNWDSYLPKEKINTEEDIPKNLDFSNMSTEQIMAEIAKESGV